MWPFKKKKVLSVENQKRELLFECVVKKNTCPDCEAKGQWLVGPRGGIAQNIKCANCGSRFNVTFFSADRI